MERMPVRKLGLSSPSPEVSPGVGVIERVDAASSRSGVRVAFLLFPSLQDMVVVLCYCRIEKREKERNNVSLRCQSIIILCFIYTGFVWYRTEIDRPHGDTV